MPNSFDDGANDDPKAVEFLDARTTLNSSEVNLNADEVRGCPAVRCVSDVEKMSSLHAAITLLLFAYVKTSGFDLGL